VVCILQNIKLDVFSAGVLEQPCILDRDLAVDSPMHEDDAMWLVRRHSGARQLPDEERDEEHHDHQSGGDEEDLTLPLCGSGDGTLPP
jgi:hypothetical protein